MNDKPIELFSIPGVAGIAEACIDGIDHVLIQRRCKKDAPREQGLIEIPAGKVRQYESVFECLRREIGEETGLRVVEIQGERESVVIEADGYRVISYSPFNSSQNVAGYYPIMVQTFICKVEGELRDRTDETEDLKWVSLADLDLLLRTDEDRFYPMHVFTLKKYLIWKRSAPQGA